MGELFIAASPVLSSMLLVNCRLEEDDVEVDDVTTDDETMSGIVVVSTMFIIGSSSMTSVACLRRRLCTSSGAGADVNSTWESLEMNHRK